MLQINIDENLLNKSSAQLIRQISKKIERELLLFQNFHFAFKVSRNTKKSYQITVEIRCLDQSVISEEFISRDWESALRQSADLLIRSVRAEFFQQRSKTEAVYGTL